MKKKLNLNLLVVIVIIAGFSVFAAVRAYENYNANQPNTIIEQAGDITINQAPPVAPNEETVGAISSPDVPYTWWTVGGVRHEYRSMDMTAATNTICALQAPSGTSTLVFASAYFKYASSTAVTVTMAQAQSPYATTTQIGYDHGIAANASSLMLASTTTALANTLIFDGTITPTSTQDYFVVSLRGGTDSAAMPTYSPSGRCVAEWIVNQY